MKPTLKTYDRIHKVIEFILSGKTEELPDGRNDLFDGVYVNIFSYETRPAESARLEAHKVYVDVQYVILGDEAMGIADAEAIAFDDYDAEKDIMFGDGEYIIKHLKEKDFCVLMPRDAHMPMLTHKTVSTVKKAVFKVPV